MAKPAPRVVSLGSINVDRVYRLDATGLEALADRPWLPARGETVTATDDPSIPLEPDAVHHGGKGANQATAGAAAGASTALLGLVGPDHDEHGVCSRLETDAVAVDGIEIASAPTGTADVFVDPDGDTRILVRSGANAAVDERYVDAHFETIAAAECVLLQNEIPTEPVVTLLERLATVSEPPTVILDPGPPAGVDELLAAGPVTYCTPNEPETAALTLPEQFQGTVIRTQGSGPVVVEGPDEQFVATPPPVETVDATGAGDVLNGYLAAGLAAGDELREALARAVAAAALSTLTPGARSSIPDGDAVAAFRAQRAPVIDA